MPPSTTHTLWQLLDTVADPEVPVLSILDLGIVRRVRIGDAVSEWTDQRELLEQSDTIIDANAAYQAYAATALIENLPLPTAHLVADHVPLERQTSSFDLSELRYTPIELVITPTYSGCPAVHAIEIALRLALAAAGLPHAQINTVLSPPWTSDWLTQRGHNRLRAYGIAPPNRTGKVRCPICGSEHTELLSQFGSTACKSLYRCQDCLEPFDYFKCH